MCELSCKIRGNRIVVVVVIICLFVYLLVLVVLLWFCIFAYRINLLLGWWGDCSIATLRVLSSRPMELTL